MLCGDLLGLCVVGGGMDAPAIRCSLLKLVVRVNEKSKPHVIGDEHFCSTTFRFSDHVGFRAHHASSATWSICGTRKKVP